MSLLGKQIDQINKEDIEQLINDQVQESRVLDYKEQLPGSSGDDKREFLYDVSAFANSGGGELVYGVSEVRTNNQPTGRPSELLGVAIDNSDTLIRQLEELIRSNMQPRIFGIQIRAIPLETGRYVLLIRIPNSLNSPHMVNMGGTQRFYTRNSAGKHPMDITEIRSSILSSAGISEKVRDLRANRISKLKSNIGFTELKSNDSVLAVHLVPFSSFGEEVIDVSRAQTDISNLWALYTSGLDYRYNFDGFLTFSKWPGDSFPHTYVQLTKQGIIEAVESGGILRVEEDGSKIIPSEYIEREIIQHTQKYFNALSNLGIRPPVVLMISMLGVRGFKLGISQRFFRPDYNYIEQQDLMLPEIILESFPTDAQELSKTLKPAFDTLWNAAGFPSSFNYNAEGEWVGQERR